MNDFRHHRHGHWLGTILFTVVLLGLIALAIGDSSPGIAVGALVSVAILATALHYLLPGGGFFSAVFANLVGIYACLYVFFISVNFGRISALAAQVGFILPLAGFLIGLLWYRKDILKTIEAAERQGEIDILRALIWIVPQVFVGLLTFLVPNQAMTQMEQDIVLLAAMSVIALSIVVASRSVALFLIDTGLLFEEFFANAARLAKPAFAFFTWYSLLAIVFGCLYTIIDRFTATPHFTIGGVARPITFAEGLYVSVVTLSTVGYGDILASTAGARLLIAAEIFVGVLLLLFGVQAVLTSHKRH